MKNEKYKHVREMKSKPTAHGKGMLATLELRCDANGLWQVNGDVCDSDTTAAVAVLNCLDSLAHQRDTKARTAAMEALVDGP
jgi:hypothetical protein